MPSYMTLTVLALAASTVSPALSAPVQVTRERALHNPELVSGKRGFGFGSLSKLGGSKGATDAVEAAAKPKKGWGSRLKSLGLNLLIGGVAAIAGTDIYSKINPNSPALGGTGRPEPAPTSDTSTPTGYPPTDPGSTTPYPGSTTADPNDPGLSTTSENGSTPQVATVPSTNGTGAPASRAIAERAREERALDHELPEDIFTRSNSNLNSRTSPHMNLLSRADLEKAIGLFSRMLDELD